ncbi:VOC family protein [Streptomyces sp. NPDC059897]|uniref:VOC family protein n=1 Tax=Streptomyces sp. NPDC059897 TaxID=3346994 RepID=UPI0036687807
MASRLNPYIAFDGDARQAMEFYQGVFGGELTLNTFGSAGGGGAPAGFADKIMHALLETPAGFTIMGSDTPPGMDRTVGTNISVSVSGDDSVALHGYWDKLAANGTVVMPLEKQMWGDEFGMCTDSFGINWMVDISDQ